MQLHRLTPEQAYCQKEYELIHRLAWKLRKLTGGALRLGLVMSVPENLREAVLEQVKCLHRKHGIQEEN